MKTRYITKTIPTYTLDIRAFNSESEDLVPIKEKKIASLTESELRENIVESLPNNMILIDFKVLSVENILYRIPFRSFVDNADCVVKETKSESKGE